MDNTVGPSSHMTQDEASRRHQYDNTDDGIECEETKFDKTHHEEEPTSGEEMTTGKEEAGQGKSTQKVGKFYTKLVTN